MLVLAMEFSRSAPITRAASPGAEEGARRSPPPASKGGRGRKRSLTTEQRRSDSQRGGDPGETEISNLPAGSSTEGRIASGQQRVPATGVEKMVAGRVTP